MPTTLTRLALALLAASVLIGTPARAAVVELDGSHIQVSFADGRLSVSEDDIIAWIATTAHAISAYYGGFPVSELQITVSAIPGQRLQGTVYRGKQPVLLLRIGAAVGREQLYADWVLAHELVHLAFPPVIRRHHWIEEGLATYVEPLARVQAGLLDERDAWRWLLTGLPKGLPRAGDQGLDNTPTWGRTYWGGALFCLLADVEIRQRTGNRYALQDALRAVVAAGGTMQHEQVWPLERALKIADQAVGVAVLSDLYRQMGKAPLAVDLQALWQRLGVSLKDDTVHFDESAPLAELRRALLRARR